MLVIPIKDGIRNKVKELYRRKLKEIYKGNKDIYKGKYKIEKLIWKIKDVYVDRDITRIFSLACIFVLMKFLLYNMSILLALFIFSLFFYTN